MKLVQKRESSDIELDVMADHNDHPSELRQLLNSLMASLKRLHHFRDMSKILAQSLDSMDVKMLSDERAQVLGQINADTYAQILSMVALQTYQLKMLLGITGQSGSELGDYEKTVKAEIDRQLEGALPEHIRVYMKKIEGKPIPTVLNESHALLADLNCKILIEFNPTLASTKYAISFSMQKIFTLGQICSEADEQQRHAALLSFTSAQMIQVFKHLDKLFEGKVQLSELAELMTRLDELVQFITSPGNTGEELNELNAEDISTILLSVIPISEAVCTAVHINQIKMLEICSEFYEAIEFSKKLTSDQFARLMDALPNLLRMALEAQTQQVVQLAWAMDQKNFFPRFFEIINDPELQASILKTTCERTLLIDPPAMVAIYQQAQEFCRENPNHPGVPLIQQLGAQYADKLPAFESTTAPASEEDAVSHAALQQASFSRFLSEVTEQTQSPAATIVQPVIYDEIVKSIDDSLIGPGF